VRAAQAKTERRQQILAHARDVFAKRGYHAAKIDDIVAAAGVARGTFYLYFEDKRAIFEEIVDRTIARIGMTILRVDPHDPARSVAEQVRENIRRLVRMLLEDRATTKILLSDALGVDPAFDRKLLSFYGEVVTLLEGSIKDGQSLGIVERGDARLFAYLTLGALKEVLSQVIARGATYEEDDLVAKIFDFFRGGYLRVDDAHDASVTARNGARSSAAPPRRTARPSPKKRARSDRPLRTR
jgi:AcrR family transcriptional regulator